MVEGCVNKNRGEANFDHVYLDIREQRADSKSGVAFIALPVAAADDLAGGGGGGGLGGGDGGGSRSI